MRSPTYFLDLDGVIFKHQGGGSKWYGLMSLCPRVRETLDRLETLGACIIIVTARKESARRITERQLEALAVPYDQLIMGITAGTRILVNDKESFVLNLNRNEGIERCLELY